MIVLPPNLSERRLLNAGWAGAIALLVIGVLLGARAESLYRHQAMRQAEVQADILAASVSAALLFDDRAAMREYVDALAVNRNVAAAGIYDAAGAPVVSYHQPTTQPPPPRAGPLGVRWRLRHVEVVRPVAEGGQRFGEVYLETRPEPWTSTLGRHSGLALLTVMALLLLGVVTAAAGQLQARARELGEANARLLDEMAARSKAEDALRQSQKMEALGQLTGGIAHDFNNLLQVVHGAFELIRRKPADQAKVAAWAENGLLAADRGASLTRQLLAFSRSQKLELKPFVVSELILDMRELLDRTLGPEIQLTLKLDDDALPVLSDRTQLELAVLNLAINARDAMPTGGSLTIATRTLSLGPDEGWVEPGRYVELSVTDTGEGMSPEVVERAFDPFFTTKDVGKGTGLGLSQVYGVARQAGGAARIESRPGAGATVKLLLRSSDAPREPPQSQLPSASLEPPAPGLTVLLVDDEAAVRRLASEILQLFGYRVLEAGSGEAALGVLATTRPDVMLFDYAMPGMNGAELANQARARWPATPIVFASGHADTAAVEAAVGGQAIILRKPFDIDSLAAAIAAAVRRAPSA